MPVGFSAESFDPLDQEYRRRRVVLGPLLAPETIRGKLKTIIEKNHSTVQYLCG